MKRSRVILLTLAGVSLGVTGCRRPPAQELHGTAILPPAALSESMRATLPAFAPGSVRAGEKPPHNAYDPALGYFHSSCAAWFPYPYNHYDSRWGYYRCGRWYRNDGTRHHGAHGFGGAGIRRTSPTVPGPMEPETGRPVAGSPTDAGVPLGAEASRSVSASRGGFGGIGKSTGFFSRT